MSYSLQNTTSLTSLADAIRSKTGDSASMTVEEMITAVNSITTGGGSSSSSGWINRRQWYETSLVNGSYRKILGNGNHYDCYLPTTGSFIFNFVFGDNSSESSSSSTKGKDDCEYLVYYRKDDDTLFVYNTFKGGDCTIMVSFSVVSNSSASSGKALRITNNSTMAIPLGFGCEKRDLTVNGETIQGYVWADLFYLDESFNEVPTINIPNLNEFNGGGRSNQIIDVLWDKLTYNIQNNYLEHAFAQYSGSHTDWRDKTISILIMNSIISLDGMFQSVEIKYPPKIVIEGANKTLGSLRWLYYNSKIKEIANDSMTIGSDVALSYGNNNAYRQRIFEGCYYLTSIPDNFLAETMYQTTSRAVGYGGRTISSGMFYGCKSLQNIIGMPYEGLNTNTMTSDMFGDSFQDCFSLRHLTFYKPNGNVGTMNAVNQTINLAQRIGYNAYAETQAELQERIEDNQAYFMDSDADYLAHISDTHAYGGSNIKYSTYNRQSAVETINSLPDTTAAIAAAGGTNTIKFSANAGNVGDDTYYMSALSPEEIAVATAKGWTVSLV